MAVNEHKKEAPKAVTLGIITVSTSRALINDTSGQWIREQAEKKGHKIVFHRVIPDDADKIGATLKEEIKESNPQVILMSGGTGITKKDVTIEAVSPLFTKELSAFGPLFAKLSMEEIDSAAIMRLAGAMFSIYQSNHNDNSFRVLVTGHWLLASGKMILTSNEEPAASDQR
jgi:molybdenum cofactor biosynthesis protein B